MMADKDSSTISTNPEELKRNIIHDEKLYQQFNGVHSSQSSRSSSPGIRLGQIPSTQLPPSRPVPQSQLPPSHPLGSVTQQIGALNINQGVRRPSPQFGAPNNPNQNSALPPVPVTIFNKDNVNSRTSNNTHQTSNSINAINSRPDIVPQLQTSSITHSTTSFQSHQAQIRNTQQSPSVNYTQGSQWPSPDKIPPPLVPVQGTKGVPMNPNLFRTSPVNPQHNFQPSTNKTGFNQLPPSGVQADAGQFSPNRTGFDQVPPNQVPVQGTKGVPMNPNLSRVSPVNPQHNFQSSTNRTGFNQLPPLGVQADAGQFSPNRTGFDQGQSSLQSQFSNQVGPYRGPPLQLTQQRVHQTPNQQHDNQRFNNSNPSQTIYNGSNVNTTQATAIGSVPTNYQQPPNVAQKANLHTNRYPTQPVNNNQQPISSQYQYAQPSQKPTTSPQPPVNSYFNQNTQQPPSQGVIHTGFNKQWGMDHLDLLQTPNILPPEQIEAPLVYLGQQQLDEANCSTDLFRCTMTKIPENNSLLQKSRLPLGVLIHPFRDLSHLPVIQCNVIVRCRACRTYINPFVLFVDTKRWKCNLCYRINELPEEFQYDPLTKTYGDPSRRPEIKASTLEYIAPAEYMLRPPQPAVYLYLLDVSKLAVESGYLNIVSKILLDEMKNIPGDARTQIGFIAYDSALHFYSLPEGINQPHEMTILDVDDVFLPTPDNLLINLKDRMDLIADLLKLLPNRYANTFDTNSALGAALQVAFKMMGATGGRVTVFQASLPNTGPGALSSREDPSNRASAEVAHLNPANDFYKRLALECSGQQIAVDMFVLNSQYVDIATISGISRFSGGSMHHFPLLKPNKPLVCENFARCFRRYITRKIGFEAVMRIRCTRGLSIHTFHGNFFVRSTDLLSLPNINPDAGFGMQVAIEESLSDVQSVCFQAALLYTSSKGERRIRVHTMCLPIASTLHDVINSADQQCIIGILSKMAVDRSMQSSLLDAREAFINVAIDILSSFKLSLNQGSPTSGLLVPSCMRILPLYISALLKHTAFRIGASTRLDDRVMKMIEMKTKPLYMLIREVYPDLFPIHNLEQQPVIMNSDEEPVSMPPRLQLTARFLENKGAFLLDTGEQMIILVCPNVPQEFLSEALGVKHYNAIPDDMFEIPILDNVRNQRLHQFINYLIEDRPFAPVIHVIRDNSSNRSVFFERLIEDRVENALSYHEFLQHLKTQVK